MMFCPQGHGSWAGDECGLCHATGIVTLPQPEIAMDDDDAQYQRTAGVSSLTRSLLVDMNSLFKDWATAPVS